MQAAARCEDQAVIADDLLRGVGAGAGNMHLSAFDIDSFNHSSDEPDTRCREDLAKRRFHAYGVVFVQARTYVQFRRGAIKATSTSERPA